MKATVTASKRQMIKAFGFYGIPGIDDGITVPVPAVENTEAGMRWAYFKRKYEPNPIDVHHQVVIKAMNCPELLLDDDTIEVPWIVEYKAKAAIIWIEARLALFANVNRSKERKKKGRKKPGKYVYTKDGARTKPVKTVSAMERWNKRAKRNAKIVAKRGKPNYGLVKATN